MEKLCGIKIKRVDNRRNIKINRVGRGKYISSLNSTILKLADIKELE